MDAGLSVGYVGVGLAGNYGCMYDILYAPMLVCCYVVMLLCFLFCSAINTIILAIL
jgi:hypothetical protein